MKINVLLCTLLAFSKCLSTRLFNLTTKILTTHPSLIQKKFIKTYHQNGQWGMIKGSCGSSKLVLPNSELLLFERKLSSKLKNSCNFFTFALIDH